MNLSHMYAVATGVMIALFFLLFGVSSFRERHPRAAWLSLGIMATVATLLIGSFVWWQPPDVLLSLSATVVWVFGLLYFLPLNKPTPMKVGAITDRVDERDTMFAREEYHPGSDKYDKYYAEHPQHKEADQSSLSDDSNANDTGRWQSEC